MRLWSLHPMYFDSRGLAALWREGLLAQAVLQGKTRGYTRHSQVQRFRATADPVAAIGAYLAAVYDEAVRRRGSGTRRGLRTTDRGGTMSNKSTLAALAAALALAAVTAASAVRAEPVPVEREKAMKSSDAPRDAKRIPASGLSSSGGTRDKSKELAADSKRRHEEAQKTIDNLKD